MLKYLKRKLFLQIKFKRGDIMKKLTTKVQVLYALGVSYAIVDQIFAQWILYFYEFYMNLAL